MSFDGGQSCPRIGVTARCWRVGRGSSRDPEEMLVVALSDCHMLSFLHVARLAGFTIAAYQARGRIRHMALGRANST
jgi:organic hydroperoxide reductase OsmC/OhrA